MIEHKFILEAVKFGLVVGHAELFPRAVAALCDIQQVRGLIFLGKKGTVSLNSVSLRFL